MHNLVNQKRNTLERAWNDIIKSTSRQSRRAQTRSLSTAEDHRRLGVINKLSKTSLPA
jgi:hypothetical protein